MPIDDYDPIIADAASQWGLDKYDLKGLIQQESRGNPAALSPKGARGLGQLMPATAAELGVTDILDPVQNIFGAAKYLRQMTDQFKSRENGIMAYNSGPTKFDKVLAGTAPLPDETRAYLPGVNGYASSYRAAAAANNSDLVNQLLPPVAKGSLTAPSVNAAPATAPANNADLINQLLPPSAPASAANDPGSARLGETAKHAALRGLATPGSPTYAGIPDEPAFLAGQQQAMRNIGITANRLIGDPLTMLPGQTAARDAYNAKYADSGSAQLGNMLGSAAATLPVMEAVNPLVARAVGYGANALTSAVPSLAPAVQGVTDFLGGNYGAATATSAARPLVSTMSNAANAGLQGAEAAAINSGQSDQPLGQQMRQGAVAGALAGGIPAAAGYAGNALTGAASSLDPEMAILAKNARDMYGVNLKAPQLGLNPSLSYVNSTLKFLPGSGVGADEAVTQGQWQQAINKEMGESGTKIFGTTVNDALKRAGGVMETIGKRTTLDLARDPTALTDLADIHYQAGQPISGLNESQINQVRANIDKIQDIAAANGGTIPGPTYLKLIRKGEALDTLQNSESTTSAAYGHQIRDVLDQTMANSAAAGDAAALQQARYQYKVAKTVQPLTARSDSISGPQPTAGDINPVGLRGAVLHPKAFGPNATLNDWGDNPLWDLARIGQRMRDPSQSGTQPRQAVQDMLTHVGRLGVGAAMGGAGVAGYMTSEIPLAVGSLAAGLSAGRALGAGLRSQTLANRMIDSSLNPLAYQVTPNPLTRSALAALAGPRANRLPPQQ